MASRSWSRNNNFYPPDRHNGNSSFPGRWGGTNSFNRYQLKAKDDETRAYAVNLQLKPVEMGITARHGIWQQKFQGLGAFNHYFGLCAPTQSLGHTLPDIWDGYFHITLAKFFTRLAPDQLEKALEKFNPSLEDIPHISDITFGASSIRIGSGEHRAKGRDKIDFVVLPVDSSPETEAFYEKVQPLLEKIGKQVESTDWHVTSRDGLHVTVRKYSNIDFELDKIKIQEFPIEFQCSHLEVKLPREQAIYRFKKAKTSTYQWWTGVTETDRKCSGCKSAVSSDEWEGFCPACGKYESIIPIWSTNGTDIRHYRQILDEELNGTTTLSTLVQNINLNEV